MDRRERFLALDALRGVAALLVFTRHVEDRTFVHLVPNSYLAVDFFFVLSGFVLAHACEPQLRSEGFWPFMRQRMIRLWPLYLLGATLGALLALSSARDMKDFLVTFVCAALFIPAALQASKAPDVHNFPLNFPSWSIFWELAVNVLYGLVARFLTWPVLSGMVALGAILVVGTDLHFGDLDGGSMRQEFLVGGGRVIFSFFFSFFAGVAAYRLHRLRPGPVLPVWLVGVVLVALMIDPHQLLVVLIGFPVLVYYAANARVTRVRLALALGGASYAFYILQAPFIRAAEMGGVQSTWVATLAMIILLSPLALLVDRKFDSPVRRRMTAFAKVLRSPA